MTSRNRNWLWFFAALVVLGIAAISINSWYNTKQQLKPEDLKAARAKWTVHGPANYDLTIRREISPAQGGQPSRDEYKVQVRAGKAVGASLNDRPLDGRLWPEYEVPAWLDYMDRFMEIDTTLNAPRVFCRAEFDPNTGQPLRYVRRVMGTRSRVELMFDLKPVK